MDITSSGSVVVTAYDSESDHPGTNPEWRLICYMASIIAQGLPKPSSLRGIIHSVPEQRNMKASLHVTGHAN